MTSLVEKQLGRMSIPRKVIVIKARFPLGDFFRTNMQKASVIGWWCRQCLSPANHIRFLLVRAKKIAQWKMGLNAHTHQTRFNNAVRFSAYQNSTNLLFGKFYWEFYNISVAIDSSFFHIYKSFLNCKPIYLLLKMKNRAALRTIWKI